ncbi:hypothetical protein [uncultured Arthrobacter sp.]|nr:hypothetical protein [uncultured Arthrobacter sp.]
MRGLELPQFRVEGDILEIDRGLTAGVAHLQVELLDLRLVFVI